MRKSECYFFHVCTDGNELSWMFKDKEDFIHGVNRILICAFLTGVKVYAYSLMDNHVHFVLYGTMPQCKLFINKYKAMTGRWIGLKYGMEQYLYHLSSQIIRIDSEEVLLDTISYIDRNPTVAGYRYLPVDYPWGSARFMFRKEVDFGPVRKISEISSRELRKLLRTRITVPGDLLVDSDGMLLPTQILEIAAAERLYKSPVRYIYFLSKKLEGKIELLMDQNGKSFIPDIEMRKIVENISNEMFGTSLIHTLDFNARIALARKLRYEYASTPKQISRMVNINHEQLSKFI